MSSRKHLVSRSRLSQNSSPAQRRPRDEDNESSTPSPLPPYEPPSFPLTANQKHALDNLRVKYDGAAYKKHLDASKKNVINAIGEANDRLTVHRMKAQRTEEKLRQQEREKTEGEVEEERYTHTMNKKVTDLTSKGEAAMRDLIDYTDELVMRDTIMTEVSENIIDVPVPRVAPRRRRRQSSGDSDVDEENIAEEEGDLAPEVTIVSPVDMLKKAKDNYQTSYNSKSMSDRYINNDYRSFKRTVHDAMHPGEGAPPVPHASTWFTALETPEGRNKRPRTSTDNEDGESDEEEDVIIAGATRDLTCPLTLQMFVEPYSNNICPHSYEKATIIEYLHENGVAFAPQNQRRGQRTAQGPKQVQCPTVGCEAMLELNDFYDDQLLLRQVKRAQRMQHSDEDEDEEDIDESRVVGSEGVNEEYESTPGEQRRSIMNLKRERQSQGQDKEYE